MSSVAREPAWLTQSRERLEADLARMPLPGRKDENYRYLSLKGFDPAVRAAAAPTGELSDERAACAPEESGVVVVRAGGLPASRSAEALPAGVTFTDLRSALAEGAQWLREALELPRVFAEDPFATLAAARWSDGVVVRVPAGARVERPLRGVHWFDARAGLFGHRTLLIVEKGAEVTYVDELGGGSSEGVAAGLVQIVAAEGARVRYAQVQGWAPGTRNFLRQHVSAAAGAEVELAQVSYGGGVGQLRLETDCTGEGARIKVLGGARGDGSQQFDFWIRAFHGVPGTASAVDYWAVMADKARAVFNGNMVITREARGTDAYQKNRNMLLSREAEIDTHPKLEIATDEVACAHGASVSPVDGDQLFYLESRGIPAAEAELMIINGFTEPVVGRLPGEALRERVHRALQAKHARTE